MASASEARASDSALAPGREDAVIAGWRRLGKDGFVAVVGGGAVVAWHLKRERAPKAAPASANRDVNLDVGESVHIDSWNADGIATVKYRGANWQVSLRSDAAPEPGPHVIEEVIGNRLIVRKR